MKIDQTKLGGIALIMFTALYKAQSVCADANHPETEKTSEHHLVDLINILDDKELVGAMRSCIIPEEKMPLFKLWPSSNQVKETAWFDNTLTVVFNSGGIYTYAGVTIEVWKDLLATDSVGKFLNSTIKGTYAFEKIN